MAHSVVQPKREKLVGSNIVPGNIHIGTAAKKTNDAKDGDVYIETDTSKLYFFDEENNQWRPWGG